MDLVDKLHEITARISAHGGAVETEEATKNAFIMPFISALGYDVFNPGEVIPEFTADIGIKKGEKVDYPRKISCSRFLAQATNSTALPKNIRLTYG